MNITKTDFFKMSNLSTRGHQHKIYKQHSSKLLRANVFSNRIVNDWNALPAEIIDAESVTAFKNKLDRYWVDEEYKTPFSDLYIESVPTGITPLFKHRNILLLLLLLLWFLSMYFFQYLSKS